MQDEPYVPHDDSRVTDPDSQQEPTVLDLYKSVTKDWASFFNFLRALWDARRRAELDRALAEETQHELEAAAQEIEPAGAPSIQSAANFPWRSVLALFLALYAQITLEPPGRNIGLALPLYILAAALLVWASVRGEWRLPALPAHTASRDPLTIRFFWFMLSVFLLFPAFLLVGGPQLTPSIPVPDILVVLLGLEANHFTVVNVSVWLALISLFMVAMWLPRRKHAAASNVLQGPRARMLWAALMLAIAALVVFYRFQLINTVPAEPFSDHAEKILDVYDITQGQTSIFFPRNTGREAFQMYWTWLVAKAFGTGLSFLSLKLGTALLGLLTLPYMYLLGKELGNARVGLFAVFLFGIGYWPNLISRMGLRFPLYPLFVAPTLFHLVRGLRTRSRNDFILCGLFLGLGLHGYSPFRIVPILVLMAFGIYLAHRQSGGARQQSVWWLTIIVVVSLFVFLPLLRYSLENPTLFSYRALSRLGSVEAPLPGPPLQIFFQNLWNALLVFNWDDGEIWVHSVPHRPGLDLVTAAFFLIGIVLLLVRYARGRDWRDLFLLVSIPVLLLPSVLSLAFPAENPALNRAAAAVVPAVLVSALALDGLIAGFGSAQIRAVTAWGLALLLLGVSAAQNYDLVFHKFDQNFRTGAWNTSEMGRVISEFRQTYGQTDTVWIVPFPHWVDTRLPGIWAGIPNRDFALWPADFAGTLLMPAPKLVMFWPEDVEAENGLRLLYPDGVLSRYTSAVPGKDFMIFFVER